MRGRNLRVLPWVVLAVLLAVCVAVAPDASGQRKAGDGTIPRIMLVGDSWPWFMTTGFAFWTYDRGSAFRDILPEYELERWSDRGITALAGSMLTEWSTNQPMITMYGNMGHLDFIRRDLMEFPTLDIVHLGLGGNDFIRGDFRPFVHTDLAGTRLYQESQWQTISFSGAPTGGTFTLTFNGQSTAPIAFGSDASVVQAALAALSGIGSGNIEVLNTTGMPTYFCWFEGIFADTTVPLMTVAGSLTGDGDEGVAVNGVTFEHGWKPTWGTESPAELAFAQAFLDQLTIVAECALDARPDVRVVLCDYDYVDEDIGGASRYETNMSLVNSGRIKLMCADQVRAKPQYANRCFYLDTFGLMQWWFGYPCDFDPNIDPNGDRHQTTPPGDQIYGPRGTAGTGGTIPPPGTYPDYTPWAGGDLNYPSPSISILYDFGKKASDPDWAKELTASKGSNIHLWKEGYRVYARWAVEKYYGAWLEFPKVIAVERKTMNPRNPDQVFSPTGTDQVVFEVTFSEPVSGVDEHVFTPAMGGGVAGASIESVTEAKDGTTYIVVVNTGVGDGTLGLTILDNDTIKDGDAKPLGGTGIGNGYFSYGTPYIINRAFNVPVAAFPAGVLLLALGVLKLRRASRP